jgi:hypothetical protein
MEHPGKVRHKVAVSPSLSAIITIWIITCPSCLCRQGRAAAGAGGVWGTNPRSYHAAFGSSHQLHMWELCLLRLWGRWCHRQGPVFGCVPGVRGCPYYSQDDQPRGFALPASVPSSSALGSPAGPRRKESTLAPSFTANNRYNRPCGWRDGPLSRGSSTRTLSVLFVTRSGCVRMNEGINE